MSTTDPDAQLDRRGNGEKAGLAYVAHLLVDNRHGLVLNACATAATSTADREAARLFLEGRSWGSTVGADKANDVASFVAAVQALGFTPPIAAKIRRTAFDRRTTWHTGYTLTQRKWNLIEQVFGWMKPLGLLRKLRHRGGDLVDWIVTLTAAAYTLVRFRTLLART